MNTMIILSIVFAIGFIIFWTIMIFRKGDIIVEIQEQNKEKTKKFKGKFVLNEATKKIRILNKTKDQIPFWSEHFIPGEKRDILKVFKDVNGMYYPIKRVFNNETSEIEEQIDFKDMTFWHTLETREGDEKYKKRKSFWESALPVIGIIVAGLIFFFSLYYANDVNTKTAGIVRDYEMKTLDLRIQEVETMNQTQIILNELKPILKDLAKRNNGQIVGVVNQ